MYQNRKVAKGKWRILAVKLKVQNEPVSICLEQWKNTVFNIANAPFKNV